jgi:uncharacterized repeat protein (TIGR03803 family)
MKSFRPLCAGTLLFVALAVAANGATPPASANFRIITDMNGYAGPIGIAEEVPGLLYSASGLAAVLSVTIQGKLTGLGGYGNEHLVNQLVSGPDQRLYSSVTYQATWTSNMLSVGAIPGSLINYPPDGLDTWLAGNLPGGTLFGTATNHTTAAQFLVKSDTQGNLTTFYRFPGTYIPAFPTYASDGNFYGVAWDPAGSGVYVYRVTPTGSGTNLYNLPSNSVAYTTYVPLIQANDGNFYGVTPVGDGNDGTLYRLTPDGQYTLLYSFPKGPSAFPMALLQGSDGNLYGASLGREGSALWRMTLSGQYALVHTMTPGEGGCPCNLIQGSDGIIYGAALNYGPLGYGSIFALNAGLPKPAPQALEFGPRHGAAGTRVRIWGYNLLQPSVSFGDVAAASASSSGPNYVWATVPTGAVTGPITVTTSGGTAATPVSFYVE